MGCNQSKERLPISKPAEAPKAEEKRVLVPDPVRVDSPKPKPADPRPVTPERENSKGPRMKSPPPAAVMDSSSSSSEIAMDAVVAEVLGKFECNEGHPLVWWTDIPFFYNSTYGGTSISCNKCSKSYSTASWHCRECNYDLCEDCAAKHEKTPHVMHCENAHELVWSPETVGLYDEEFNSPSFSCNTCKNCKQEPNWNCDECKYDCCIQCGIDAGFNPPQNLIVCDQGHLLHPDRFERTEEEDYLLRCNACVKDIETVDLYRCGKCEDYDMCMNCVHERIAKMVPHPDFKCIERKALVLKQVDGVDEEFRCSSCGKGEMKKAFACEECKTCYCLRCSKKMALGLNTCHKKKCPNGHQLAWDVVPTSETGAIECNVCGKENRAGHFRCEECGYCVCINDIGSHS